MRVGVEAMAVEKVMSGCWKERTPVKEVDVLAVGAELPSQHKANRHQTPARHLARFPLLRFTSHICCSNNFIFFNNAQRTRAKPDRV
jgi:hypothetical protein